MLKIEKFWGSGENRVSGDDCLKGKKRVFDEI